MLCYWVYFPGLYISLQVRNVPDKFNETKHVFFAVYNFVFTAAIGAFLFRFLSISAPLCADGSFPSRFPVVPVLSAPRALLQSVGVLCRPRLQ